MTEPGVIGGTLPDPTMELDVREVSISERWILLSPDERGIRREIGVILESMFGFTNTTYEQERMV
jgi:hypothetical protein